MRVVSAAIDWSKPESRAGCQPPLRPDPSLHVKHSTSSAMALPGWYAMHTSANPKHMELRSVQVRIQASIKRQGKADNAKSQARKCSPAGLCARTVSVRLSNWCLTILCIFDVCMVLFRHAVMAHLSRAEDPELGGRLKTAESLRDAP